MVIIPSKVEGSQAELSLRSSRRDAPQDDKTGDTVTGEGLPSPVWVIMWLNRLCNLAFSAHALLGDQQHGSADSQQTANDVEDGGTHTAGLGQLSTGQVDDL